MGGHTEVIRAKEGKWESLKRFDSGNVSSLNKADRISLVGHPVAITGNSMQVGRLEGILGTVHSQVVRIDFLPLTEKRRLFEVI